MRMTSAMIDGRQLKICATCFDIAVALLRVVEMTASLAPEVYLDFDRPSAELLLCRLCQVYRLHFVGTIILYFR